MKTMLTLLFALVFHFSAIAAEPLKWIVITTETIWPDGRGCDVGEVEVALKEDATDYFVWAENGQQYRVPKTNGKPISSEDAALMLIQKRQAMYVEKHALMDELEAVAPVAANKPEGPRERSRRKKAERDAKAKAAVDSFYQWKLRNFIDRVR